MQQPQSFDSSYPPTATPSDNVVLAPEDLTQVDKDLIFEGLKNLYKKKVLPLEVASKYSHFSSPPMGPSDFDAKPMVLILGQYSVGKTSFIRSLLKQDFPGQRIGPGGLICLNICILENILLLVVAFVQFYPSHNKSIITIFMNSKYACLNMYMYMYIHLCIPSDLYTYLLYL